MTTYIDFKNWLQKHLAVSQRLRNICTLYLIFLMVSTRKHTLEEAAKFTGCHKSQFSRFLKNHSSLAVYQLDSLSKKQARQFAKLSRALANGTLPWNIAIVIDSTLQKRTSLHAENAKKFNHGKGYVIGHQWTNIIMLINDVVIPLRPIPFYSKGYCKKNGLEYLTENTAVIRYLNKLNLEDYVGPYCPEKVVVLADSGYDDKQIERAVCAKKWIFIIALKKTRSVKSTRECSKTNENEGWTQVAEFFKRHRWAKWLTIRVPTKSQNRKRMEFRIRQIEGYLRHVGKVRLICSEFKKRPDGRRKYLACNDLRAKARLIIIGYRLRWAIEIFHKEIKMFLGFEEVATWYFDSVMAHVHWVYCTYALLNHFSPGQCQTNSLKEKQQEVARLISTKETSRVIQMLTQFNGPQRYKEELQRSLLAA